MNLRWIALFATIAEEESFTRAATKLNIAQPWLSAQLRKLEYELGVQLLIRENVGVKVTEAGMRLLPYAKQLAEAARLFRETARSLGETRSKVVKLGCHVPIIDMPALKAITLDFSSKYSHFELNTLTESPSVLVKALDECSIDLALLPFRPAGSDPAVQYCSFGQAQVYLLVPAKRKNDRVEALAGEPVGLPPRDWNPELHARLVTLFDAAGLVPHSVPEFDKRAIEHGVKTRGTPTVIALGEHDLATLDPAIHALALDGFLIEHMLCRVADRELGRAAERFWNLCKRKAVAEPAAQAETIRP